jgi:DNA helicase-2/ATP-dependent DNA helicase PcrA
VVDQVLELSGYLEDLNKKDLLGAEERIGNLKELKSVALEFDQSRGGNLADFLSEVALTQDADGTDYSDAVSMMTFHSAKGLEFPVVFMTGMEEGVFPSSRTETDVQMEEERRLCYVGITRARERLFLTNAINRLLYGYEMRNLPSRFLDEIPKELFADNPLLGSTGNKKNQVVQSWPQTPQLLELQVGDEVQHRKFGRGVVMEIIAEDIVLVEFDIAGSKMLKTDIAPLIKV